MKIRATFAAFASCLSITACIAADNLQPAKLLANLPDSCPTPDAFTTAPDGSLTLSCPNWAVKGTKGMLLSISEDGKVTEIGAVKTKKGFATPMGLAYGDDGELYIANNAGPNMGSILRVELKNGKVDKVDVVAKGMSSPNGIRYHNGDLYLTQLRLPKAKTPQMSSGLYRFKATDRNVKVSSDLTSPNLIFSEQTRNPDRQFGLDGLVFDSLGRLYVGDFGDGEIYRLTFKDDGTPVATDFVRLPNTTGIDGIAIDKNDNIYATGFLQNQIWKVTPAGKASLLADYPDNDGSNGQIDQPADIWVWNDKVVISNFDLMKGKGIENSGHSKPYTTSYISMK